MYVNDEGTRTFLGLTVTSGLEAVAETSRRLDRCLAEYRLPPFYEVRPRYTSEITSGLEIYSSCISERRGAFDQCTGDYV